MSRILIANMKMIDPLNIKLDDIDLQAPLRALPRLPRYSGQTRLGGTYRVAEHVVKLADVVPPHLRRAALLHDCSEGFGLLDFPHPVKCATPGYKEIEERMLRVIFERFDVSWAHMRELEPYDRRICQDEMLQIFDEPFDLGLEPLGITVEFWDEDYARARLREAFEGEGWI